MAKEKVKKNQVILKKKRWWRVKGQIRKSLSVAGCELRFSTNVITENQCELRVASCA